MTWLTGRAVRCADRRQQRLALAQAAAAVDHRHAALADDEAEIGDAAGVVGREVLVRSLVDEDARGRSR